MPANSPKVMKPVQYNRFVRVVAFAGLLLLAACIPSIATELPAASDLRPYSTATQSETAAGPTGLASAPQPLPSPTPSQYHVASGDTLSQIAEKYHVSLDALLVANPGVNPNALTLGQMLNIPGSPANIAGEATPTPVPLPVEQVACYRAADRGLWCFVLLHDDGSEIIEDVTAQITLMGTDSKPVTSQTALLLLDIVPPSQSMPLTAYFEPDVPTNVQPQVQILTGIRLLPGDPRYLPAAIQNSLVQVAWSGLSALITGDVVLPATSKGASTVWVAAVAYDGSGKVVGVRRWESSTRLGAGATMPFSFIIASVANKIERVEFAVEARP
jgi:LysM repeat protein